MKRSYRYLAKLGTAALVGGTVVCEADLTFALGNAPQSA